MAEILTWQEPGKGDPLPVIRVDQLGYAPKLPKEVAVTVAGDYVLTDAEGAEVRTYPGITPKEDEASGDTVAMFDLGELAPGRYTLTGGGESREITVSERPWKDVTNALIKGFYYQRCDELKEEHAGVYRHPACHTGLAEEWRKPDPPIPEDVRAQIPPHFLKMLEIPPEEPLGEKAPAPRRIKGGWHDAGDSGTYVGPGAGTVCRTS